MQMDLLRRQWKFLVGINGLMFTKKWTGMMFLLLEADEHQLELQVVICRVVVMDSSAQNMA